MTDNISEHASPITTSDKIAQITKDYFSKERIAENIAGAIMLLYEGPRDAYGSARTQYLANQTIEIEKVIPQGEVENFVYQHIGDVFEVSMLYGVTRAGLFVINESLKKIINKEIPDEACFWASMITSVAIPSMIELNITHLPQGFQNVSDPADLFGIAVGAIGIATAHYVGKYNEPIKEFGIKVGKVGKKAAKFVGDNLRKFNKTIGYGNKTEPASNLAADINPLNKKI